MSTVTFSLSAECYSIAKKMRQEALETSFNNKALEQIKNFGVRLVSEGACALLAMAGVTEALAQGALLLIAWGLSKIHCCGCWETFSHFAIDHLTCGTFDSIHTAVLSVCALYFQPCDSSSSSSLTAFEAHLALSLS